jgi:SNF2 family DNA or RNA helicase
MPQAPLRLGTDPWWNPAVQAHATDRAYRIGQKNPVFVYNLIAAGSVEERMLALQQHKRRLADAILAEGGTAAPTLTERDVDDLMAPLE